MPERRWKDPRTLRVWKVDACTVSGQTVLCFESTATPRNGHDVRCCPGVATALSTLDDQSLALCLDAARSGGFLWLDPRDRQVWWVRRDGGPEAPDVRLVGCVGELRTRAEPGRLLLTPDALASLLDRATTARSAA